MKNDVLVSESTTKRIVNGIRIPRLRRRAATPRPDAPQRRAGRIVDAHAARHAASSAASANAAARIAPSVDRVALELGHEPAAAHHEHAVREADHLLELGRDQQDAEPSAASAARKS